MEKDLVSGKIGSVGDYDLAFKSGKLAIVANVSEGPVSTSAGIMVSADLVIDALEKAIPNVIAKEVLEAVRAALKA